MSRMFSRVSGAIGSRLWTSRDLRRDGGLRDDVRRVHFLESGTIGRQRKDEHPTHIGLNPAAAALIGGADDLMTLEVVEASR
jgi:hypothetical protein